MPAPVKERNRPRQGPVRRPLSGLYKIEDQRVESANKW